MFGRGYGAVESYRAEDAELLLVTSGTVTSTARSSSTSGGPLARRSGS